MPTEKLERLAGGSGPGEKALHHATVSAQDGDTYDTGLDDINRAWAEGTTANAGTDWTLVNVQQASGGTLNINMADVDGSDGGAAIGSDEDIDIYAIGEV